jgi:hypothetical protein
LAEPGTIDAAGNGIGKVTTAKTAGSETAPA